MQFNDPNTYALTLKALHASLSSYISKPEREECDRFLQELKQRAECMDIISQVLAEEEAVCSQYVKLLALTILNDWIKLWWNKLPEERKLAVKQLSVSLVTSNLAVHDNSSIRTKIAVILSNVVERVFPQYWPTFLKEMVDLWVASPFARQDVILKMLETVIVDSVDQDFNSALPTLRRQEIVAGIVEAQQVLFTTSFDYLGYCFQEYTRLSAESNPAGAKVVREALLSLLSMLSALTALVKVEDFCAAPHNFALVLVGMCNTPQVQDKAMEVLGVLAYHHMSVELFAVVLQALAQLEIRTWPDGTEESLQFQRTYAGLLHNLLSQHVQYVLDGNSTFYQLPNAAGTLAAYIRKMLAIVEQSPSVRLSGDVIKDWVKIYREKNVSQCPTFRDVAMTVLNLFMQKCRKPLWTEYPANATHAQNAAGARVSLRSDAYEEAFELEFEDTDEWATDYYGTFKSQFRLLSQTISEQFGVLSAQTLSQYLASLVQAEGAQGAIPATCVEFKTQLLSFDMLHYVYAPLLQTLIVTDGAKKASNEGGKDAAPPMSEADRKLVLNVTGAAMEGLLSWKPHTPQMQLEQFKILQYHYPILKLSTQHLAATFSLLFAALSESIATASATDFDRCTKIAGNISSLTQNCAAEIVKTGFFQEFFQQVGGLLTQVPYLPVKNYMRQSLMAMSDHIPDASLRVQTLGLAVEDVLQKWTTEGAVLFTSSDALLEALIAQVARTGDMSPDNRFEDMKRSIDTFLLAAKRITYPPVPMEVWTQNQPVSFDEFMKIFPFAPAWLQSLPVAFQGINVLHSIWEPAKRQSLEEAFAQGSAQLPPAQVELLTAICLPDPGDIVKFAGVKNAIIANSTALAPKFAFELKELRVFLYQLLAQAAAHKTLYYVSGVDDFLAGLVAHLPLMEHAHLVLLMRNFVDQYVLNALPMFYPQVSKFLEGFLSTTLQRLSTAWDRSTLAPSPTFTAEQMFYWRVYRMCSIPEGFTGLPAGQSVVTNEEGDTFSGFTREEIENAREHLIGEATRAYADVLASFLGLKGFLFTPYASAATAAAAEYMHLSPKAGSSAAQQQKAAAQNRNNTNIVISGKGKNKSVQKRVSFDNTEPEVAADSEKAPLTDEQQLELGKHARRQALFALLHTSYPGVTQAFVSSVVTLICLPDANACKFAIQMAQKMLDLSLINARFIVPVAKDAFSAALSVLLQQEKWSIGLEWELIEYVLDAYLMLVVGEGRNPVNVSAGSGYASAATSPMAGTGGTLVPLHQHAARSDWPKQLLLSLGGMTREKLAEFDVNLQKMLAKKKRRGLMKDLITDVIAANKGGVAPADSGAGSVFSATVPSVLDVRHRLMRSNAARKQGGGVGGGSAEVDLSRLFDA